MNPEFSIITPCLNEAATLSQCIGQIRRGIALAGIDAEIIVVDNGSTDASAAIAQRQGAVVVPCGTRGYGHALMAGFAASRGKYIVMGDCDMSYDFTHLPRFVEALRSGAHMAVGDRFADIRPGAMPWLHRYVGVPFLSWLGRRLFGSPVHDFHCGLRAMENPERLGIVLTSGGMEMASELIVEYAVRGLRVVNVPTTLRPYGQGRKPHVRTFRDGWRHVRYLVRRYWQLRKK